MEMPSRAKTMLSPSSREFCFMADRMPMGTEISTARAMASRASFTV